MDTGHHSEEVTPDKQVEATHVECHRIICTCGIEGWSGDRYHHMGPLDVGPCTCGKTRFRIICPPNCTMTHPQSRRRTYWDVLLEDTLGDP